MRAILSLLLLALLAVPALAADSLTLAAGGRTDYQIVLPAAATPAQQHAGEELARFLGEITGAAFPVISETTWTGGPALFVGLSPAARHASPTATRQGLGHDGLAIETAGRNLLLYGSEPRGTLYAVYTFLEDHLGCRWWAPGASTIPKQSTLAIPALHDRQAPILEYREPFFHEAFDGDWAVRNKCNSASARLDAARGGRITYQGFVHTFYQLVPPEKYFTTHPEWYAMVNGQRTADRSQLCLTNPELPAVVAAQVKEWLRANPAANIVSVSQTDGGRPCTCPRCAALDAKEGSPAGSLLHFVNAVARLVRPAYPNVAIDTLAYTYSRKPPRFVRPEPNVIVRLCTIECDLARPLTWGGSRAFYDDLVGWGKIAPRLYVWDYVTNFGHYMRPQPNVFVLGENVRALAANGVRGIFSEGSYEASGGDMSLLKAWVLAKVLWNPNRDADALIREFTTGYYGPAGPYVYQYLQLLHRTALRSGLPYDCFENVVSPWPSYATMVEAEGLFAKGFQAVSGQPELENRLRLAHLPLLYTWLHRLDLQRKAEQTGFEWAPGNSALAGLWAMGRLCAQVQSGAVGEGQRFDWEAFAGDRTPAALPAGLDRPGAIDVQDYAFFSRMEGRYSCQADPTASDGWAVVLPGDQDEGAETQIKLGTLGVHLLAAAKYHCYAVIKCELCGTQGDAFGTAFFDEAKQDDQQHRTIPVSQIRAGEWQVHDLGVITLQEHPKLGHFWVGMVNNGANVKSVAVDRFLLVPEK